MNADVKESAKRTSLLEGFDVACANTQTQCMLVDSVSQPRCFREQRTNVEEIEGSVDVRNFVGGLCVGKHFSECKRH